ncbi:cellulose synthase/poly-beta-1,6-N-acetylglucosamine synthase-like glycosyltransferase [Arenibacter algicola]|jgi:cellulose synthase/poly-beta-1,6-N-acetylglucosamine synthase-like glycosyltransferase|uniref:Cellulose synthase/poly-beta-1,6-N-acetylglucosamine synthase-like glycosyltransferase n=1 Tax=Arenibacter algicola TaxID=616991 RepID=A0ABY3AH22_9FLAO|nr:MULTISPECIES: cellulose synthase family protein [Arenibacter]GBF21365.1 beta-monoglucosyldiacylglycerol synthase [Arenibacter sp. NBRC 103722]|tara:strand:- start:4669 stop:6153 length:1485 start_codon:yes stop_codon:yes gene_type:complete
MGLTITYFIIAIYSISLLLIFFYSLAQLNLLVNYLGYKRRNKEAPKYNLLDPKEIPFVTIQLPIYNEEYVVERLLDNISKIEYPMSKLEIQVLDDSTDDSVHDTAKRIKALQETGLDIQHIRRTNRQGYKAGALKEGLDMAKGEFIAIFDADFLPSSDWLKKTVIYFKDQEIGVVQTRWGHINREYSTLTRIQAFALDAHFTLEQVGRNAKGHFINFNGTAGIWRKECILDAGNWEGDTLTEDLDLSYRAQLKNWKFKYLEDVETPAELPVVISAARSQQFRWNKGGAENFRKTVWSVISAKNISFKTKFHGVMHLLNSSMFLCVFLVALLSIPMMYIKNTYGHLGWVFEATSFFILSTVILFVCYWFTYKSIQGSSFDNFVDYIRIFFTFFSVALGFSLHNSIAVLEGHMGKRSEFVRTPKFNLNSITDSWKGNKYLATKLSPNMILEAALMLYFLFGMYSAIPLNDFGLFPFHFMLFLGFGYVFFKSLMARA